MHAIKFAATRFIEDCLECDCDIGVFDWKSRTLQCTALQAAELRNRAEFYADPYAVDASIGLRKSAQATLKTLAKHGL